MEAYLKDSSYQRSDTPETLLDSMRTLLDAYIEDDAVPFALAHRQYRLAVTTARAKNFAASEISFIQRLGVGSAWLFNALNPDYLRLLFERVVFYSGALPPRFCLRQDFCGKTIPLDSTNFKAAILASGAIPVVIAGVRDIYGAPRGAYRDGGVFDYHLNHEYTSREGEVTLFFNHMERIVPGWFDKGLKSRRPPAKYWRTSSWSTPVPVGGTITRQKSSRQRRLRHLHRRPGDQDKELAQGSGFVRPSRRSVSGSGRKRPYPRSRKDA